MRQIAFITVLLLSIVYGGSALAAEYLNCTVLTYANVSDPDSPGTQDSLSVVSGTREKKYLLHGFEIWMSFIPQLPVQAEPGSFLPATQSQIRAFHKGEFIGNVSSLSMPTVKAPADGPHALESTFVTSSGQAVRFLCDAVRM